MAENQSPLDDQHDAPPQLSLGRVGQVILVSCLVIAVAGFVVGIQDDDGPANQPLHGVSGSHDVGGSDDVAQNQYPDAPRYEMLGDGMLDRLQLYRTEVQGQAVRPVDMLVDVPKASEPVKLAAIAARSDRRAYSGAPPVIPHQIDQRRPESCMSCHGEGMKLGSVVAPKLSHKFLTNCTQCHVESSNRTLVLREQASLSESHFVGMASPSEGTRAWRGAPPTIPHATMMRENCTSCHGPSGKEGIRSSHPYRQNCNQCHAQSAALNQRLNASESPFPFKASQASEAVKELLKDE
ncbi:nitrate reductase cytochrome c-type subunit [Poriferisphaera sp. WC338]|uniref:nitrate reductase cytochrome c-type subunit n=1 Tax=Poriferisphaera sp. WC338 TaxID=3425129 RepID=UPI003D818FB3